MATKEDVKPTPSTSKVVECSEEDISTLMAKGKRHYVCQETLLAVECFAQACNMASSKYGQTSSECAEPYLYYGKALLDLARMENGVLGNALGQGPELEEDDNEDLPNQDGPSLKDIPQQEREEIRLQVEEAMSGSSRAEDEQFGTDQNSECNATGETAAEDKEAKDGEEEEEEEVEEVEEEEDVDAEDEEKDAENKEKNAENEGKDDEKEDEGNVNDEKEVEEFDAGCEENDQESEKGDKDDEEVSNMQLSWEMLELSKLISARQGDKESKLRHAEAAKALGEINLELEHYPEAIADFSESMRLLNELLEEHDRRLAEANYNLALAFSFDRQFDKAISQFKTAISVIHKRIHNIEVQISQQEQEQGKEKASDTLLSLQKELQDLKDLIPEMSTKIEDAEDMKKSSDAELCQVKQFAVEALGGVSGFDAPTQAEAKPAVVTDIGHLVRKKRKPEEEEESPMDSKKAKQSDEDSGDVTGQSCNGH